MDDLWYDEAELLKWSPELVEEYKAGKKFGLPWEITGREKAPAQKGRSTVR